MARVTYGAFVTELRGSLGGTVFQKNAYGFTAKNSPNLTTPNSANQDIVKRAVTRCVQRWGALDAATKSNWDTYAVSFPQFAKHNSGSILSGYAVFLKRNMVAEIIGSFLLDNPDLIPTTDSTLSPTLETNGTDLLLTFNPSPSPVGINSYVQMSNPMPSGYPIRINQVKGIIGFGWGSGSVNCATTYLSVFGRLPVVGEAVLVAIQNLGDSTGAVYAKQYIKVTVTSL